MSLHRFFLSDQALSDNVDGLVHVKLDKEDLRHLKAARISPGELVAIIDKSSNYYQCEVIELDDNGFAAKISAREKVQETPFSIHLFQGVPKAGKLDDVVRHGTEIGIDAFYPLVCKRSIAKLDDKKVATKVDRLRRIAKSAAIQSGRDQIPSIHLPIDVEEAAKLLATYNAAIIFWEEADFSATLHDALSQTKEMLAAHEHCDVAVIVGPEGGLDDSEVTALLSSCETAAISTLGPYILRTETAGVVGSALVSYELGGMGAAPFPSSNS